MTIDYCLLTIMKKSKIENRKSKIGKAPQIICRQAGRGVSRKEAHEKANSNFTKEYKIPWIERISIPSKTKYFDYDKVFGKKKKAV